MVSYCKPSSLVCNEEPDLNPASWSELKPLEMQEKLTDINKGSVHSHEQFI